MWAGNLIKTRREDVELTASAKGVASIRLGGITLWAAEEKQLAIALKELRTAIEEVLASHLTVAKNVLKKLVQDRLGGAPIEDKVFSAVLGWALRCGNIDAIVCGSKNDKPFRVFIHASHLPQWRNAVEDATAILLAKHELIVRHLEKRIFCARAYNTWSSTAHVLGYLSYRGVAEFIQNDTCRLVEDLLQC